MAARLAVLAFAALSLAACETASTEDTAIHRGAAPTLGDLGHHQRGMVRGPVVADAAPTRATAHHAAAHPAAARATTTAAAARTTATRTASVVPNPMRAAHTAAPATTAATDAAPQPSTLPTEPAQPASVTAQQAETPAAPAAIASEPQSTIGAYPSGSDASTVPVSEQPVQPTAPIEFGIGDLTPDKISAMFGGMPFLLIASIAAALVAALGLALRPSKPEREQEPEYNGPHVVDYDEDHREPYAA